MTNIFRSSFYGSKQPDPLEEEEAAGEYRDLEGGVGGKDGGARSTPAWLLGVLGVIFIGVGIFFMTLRWLNPETVWHDDPAMAGIVFVIYGVVFLVGSARRCCRRPSVVASV